MYLALDDEQSFLVEAADGALARVATIEATRAANDGDPYLDLWPLAVEAGWPGLLVPESGGGVGLGAYEAMLVLEVCGRRVADARLLGHLPASLLVPSPEVASGDVRAALVDVAVAERGSSLALVDGVLDGVAWRVVDVPGADLLVVVADGGVAAVDAGADGVEVRVTRGYDGSRLVGDVTFSSVAVERLDVERPGDAAALQQALLAAEAVGGADACLAMAREYAIDRIAFGRPIGSYQAIKHKLVEMLRRVQLGRSALVGAGRAWSEEHERFPLMAQAARVTAIRGQDYCAAENVFVHGGVGATWEHDASVLYRRGEHARRLAGGADAAAARVADELLAR